MTMQKPQPTPLLLPGDVKTKESATPLTPSLPDLPKYGPHNPIPFARIIRYLKKGMNYAEVGKQFGVSKQAIFERCLTEDYDVKEAKAYSKGKVDIFEHKQRLMVNSLTTDRIKNMAPGTAIIGIGVLEDKIQALKASQGTLKDDNEAEFQAHADDLMLIKRLKAEVAQDRHKQGEGCG